MRFCARLLLQGRYYAIRLLRQQSSAASGGGLLQPSINSSAGEEASS